MQILQLISIQYAFLILIATALVKSIYTFLSCPLRKIPGPAYTRITNLVLKFHVITGNRCHYIHALHQRYGGTVRISPTEVAIADHESTQKIHKINSGFLKTDWYLKFTDEGAPGIFAMTNPHQHATRRKLFAQAFSKTSLRSTWEQTVREKVELAVEGMLGEIQRSERGEVDVMKWWTFMATDVSGHLMFGESFDMLKTGVKTEYIEVLEKTMMGAGIGSELPLVRWIGRLIPSKSLDLMFNGNAYLSQYGEQAVRNARGVRGNIFSNAIAEAEKGNGSLSDDDVKQEASNLIVAGSDTTAITLTYLTWAVLSQPRLRLALEAEAEILRHDFKDTDLETLDLCNATIEEALRLYGAAPGSLPRAVPPGGTTLNDYFIPAGTTVSTQAWTTHRDPNIFESPETFDPYRWTNKTSSLELAKAAMYPFGKGSRTCLGIHVARMELRYGLALFLRRCKKLKLAPSVTQETMAVENFFLIAPKAHECMLVAG